jgi:hypothetical protein
MQVLCQIIEGDVIFSMLLKIKGLDSCILGAILLLFYWLGHLPQNVGYITQYINARQALLRIYGRQIVDYVSARVAQLFGSQPVLFYLVSHGISGDF